MEPLMPPAALISSTAILVAFCMIWPEMAEEPDSGQIRPRLKAPSTAEDSEVPAGAVDSAPVEEAVLPQAVVVMHMAAAMIQAIVFFIVSLSFHCRGKRGYACMHTPSE